MYVRTYQPIAVTGLCGVVGIGLFPALLIGFWRYKTHWRVIDPFLSLVLALFYGFLASLSADVGLVRVLCLCH